MQPPSHYQRIVFIGKVKIIIKLLMNKMEMNIKLKLMIKMKMMTKRKENF